MKSFSHYLKVLGPGLIWAGAAIGVSHLVQSTTAGAHYGFALVWAIILAMVLKYPFFEFGVRYAVATGETLLDGYKRIGSWAFYLFFILTVLTMFGTLALVTLTTASIAPSLFQIELTPVMWSFILFVVCAMILGIGHYKILDVTMKGIIILLTISTFLAVFVALWKMDFSLYSWPTSNFDWLNSTDIIFLIALMGWMPCPMDSSVWLSFWSCAKSKLHVKQTWEDAKRDQNIGYWGTLVLALAFLLLGVLVMNLQGIQFSAQGGEFIKQFIQLYTSTLGDWVYPVIVLAAFATMLSTTLTIFDAYPRILRHCSEMMYGKDFSQTTSRVVYWIWMLTVGGGALLIIAFYQDSLRSLVLLITVIAFLVAPLLAYLNLKLVTSDFMPSERKPSKFMIYWSYVGLIYLAVFVLIYFSTWF